jgi:hypothetical protein
MPDEIKPALSAEEWDRLRANRRELTAWATEDSVSVLCVSDSGDPPGAFNPDDRHALAALALHGQPFGFTWGDVEDLIGAVDVIRGMGWPGWVNLDNLRARIAALLPPDPNG